MAMIPSIAAMMMSVLTIRRADSTVRSVSNAELHRSSDLLYLVIM